MRKKALIGVIASACAAVLALGAVGGYALWRYRLPKFHDVTLELGAPLPSVSAFLTEYANEKKAKLVTAQDSIDLTQVGVQELTFSHRKKTETVLLTIEDTTAPMLTLRDVSADIGTELRPTDFVEEVIDHSIVTLSFSDPLPTPEGYGDVEVEVIATDESGNETRGSCILSYVWMRSQLTLELGTGLSKGDILMNPEKDGDLLEQSVLDELVMTVGTYPISATTSDGKTGTCQITVVDTVAPELKVKDVTVYDGQPVSMEDFLVSATDLSGSVTTRLLQKPDTAAVGTYTLTVEAVDQSGNTSTAEVKLAVIKDQEPPVFSGLKKLSTDKDKKPDYTAGVSATDAKDGKVTFEFDASAVNLSKPGTYTVTYTAKDKAGNLATEQRKVTVLDDTKAPVFSGLKDITTDKHEKPDYTSGVSATDNWDGKVEFTYDDSKVDLTKAGTYYVTYTAKDQAGNKATGRRKVVVNHDQEDTKALVREVAAGLGSDPEAIRDYVRNSIKYSSDWGGDDPVWFGFKNKKGNCYVHAMCLQELLEAKGYETKLIWVTDKSHYWNLVKINGTWKHIDATPGVRHTKYSLMNDEQRLETLSGRKWDTSLWPECE